MAKTETWQHAVPVTIESTTANDDSMDYTSTAQSLKYLIGKFTHYFISLMHLK